MSVLAFLSFGFESRLRVRMEFGFDGLCVGDGSGWRDE